RLLSHEVAHTLQQGSAATGIAGKLTVGAESGPAERGADRAADAVMRGEPVPALGSADPGAGVLRRTCRVPRHYGRFVGPDGGLLRENQVLVECDPVPPRIPRIDLFRVTRRPHFAEEPAGEHSTGADAWLDDGELRIQLFGCGDRVGASANLDRALND